MNDPTSIYQQIILDHYREKHHAGLREPYNTEVHHVNPSCGDEVTLRVALYGDRVSDVSYDALGCSISQASESIMTDLIIGRSLAETAMLYREFKKMMESAGRLTPNEDLLQDAIAFNGVAQFPGRVKCAMLGWAALRDALLRAGVSEAVSMEG
ncbi:MAG: SUF system NifU family Fe-S cluster assembly protein [Propionibacteriaceae bacterium]|jgi:nitrogen fixation NifU-like protein|nr:SUF system NifU family Fe-S cluster assembly protein [Propionibacteriaceae bacterium]